MTEFTFVELFAGIGGVSYGFEANGGKCVLAAEYDPVSEGKRQFAQEAYKLLHPGVRVEGDVFKLDEKEVPDHDVLSFTTPCQSFSVAGKRLGFEDTRGTLVFEALRIAKHKKPKVIFMENVKGLVNHDKGHTIDTILHAMNEVGYVVDFNILNSKYFGVPQNRERVFIIGVREDLIKKEEWNKDRLKGNTMLHKRYKALCEQGLKTFNFDWPTNDKLTFKLKDILEENVDEKYILNNDKTKKLINELHSDVDKLAINEATKLGYTHATVGDSINVQYPNSKTRRGRVGKEIANTLEASGCNQAVVIPTITPFREEKRQNGSRFKLKEEISHTVNTQDKHGVSIKIGNINPSGNGMNGNVYASYGDVSPTLTTNKGEGLKLLHHSDKWVIRKLTPRECMRLQGFPDEATDLLYKNGFSDSRIYKFAGNAVTTNVIKELSLKLLNILS